ncbi:MAG TPA: hypothetical protein VK885_08745 [Desulfotignum sp.]|jgi:hypothetical protein|nr:hypothetical protein [Desulfotignum sp.]
MNPDTFNQWLASIPDGTEALLTLLRIKPTPLVSLDDHLHVYAFANTTVWMEYEGIQSDIFDHVLAVIPQFGLRLHQTPAGHDIREAVKDLARVSDRPTPAAGS